MPRIYQLENVWNVRDFGGLQTPDGSVRMDRLFRTGALNRVSEADKTWFDDRDLSLLVDLRYHSEREAAPNLWPGDRDRLNYLEPMHERTGRAPHQVYLEEGEVTVDSARAHMTETYQEMPKNAAFQAGWRETLMHMAGTGEPILIHCAAGKDRTGVLGALILTALGVSEDDIFDEYMMTMEAVDFEALLPLAQKSMKKRYGRMFTPEQLLPIWGVERGYLKAAFETMGSPEDFIRDTLGFTDDDKERLRAHYISA